MSKYDEHTVREWFVRDNRGAHHTAEDERHAREMATWNPDADSVVLYRDVTYGPMVEAS